MADWQQRGATPYRVRLVVTYLCDVLGGDIETAIREIASMVHPWHNRSADRGLPLHPAKLEAYIYGHTHLDPQDFREAARRVGERLRPKPHPGDLWRELEVSALNSQMVWGRDDGKEWLTSARDRRLAREREGWHLPGQEAAR